VVAVDVRSGAILAEGLDEDILVGTTIRVIAAL
jgi:hypothetical protein